MRISKTAVEAYRKLGFKEAIIFCTHVLLRGGLSSRPRMMKYAGLLHPFYNFLFSVKYGQGTDIMAEDWDNLIILDACRYDDFQQLNNLPGNLESRIAKAADSKGFVIKNFCGRELHDTVYVTANPHIKYIDDDVFHAVVDEPIDQWDSSTMCVKPASVTEAAKRAHDKYPNKRLIIHYMQPHDPPLGPTAEELADEMDIIGAVPERVSRDHPSGTRYIHAVAAGDLSLTKARKAYRETLEIVLEDVQDLLDYLDGKSVITADHGEMFGENPYPFLGKLYDHYFHPRTPELCKVPWHIVQNGTTRRTVHSDPPKTSNRISQNRLENQLRDLGYM